MDGIKAFLWTCTRNGDISCQPTSWIQRWPASPYLCNRAFGGCEEELLRNRKWLELMAVPDMHFPNCRVSPQLLRYYCVHRSLAAPVRLPRTLDRQGPPS